VCAKSKSAHITEVSSDLKRYGNTASLLISVAQYECRKISNAPRSRYPRRSPRLHGSCHDILNHQLTKIGFVMQWSSVGRPVCLVDPNEQQLSKAQDYIRQLRGSSPSGPPQGWGTVSTFSSSRLKEAVAPSWLVIEVSLQNPIITTHH
jgi:hypothetical protein